jgi:hypothetical protein
VLRAVLALPEFWPGKNLRVLLRNGHRLRPKRCARREIIANVRSRLDHGARNSTWKRPSALVMALPRLRTENQSAYPLAAAPWLDRADEYTAIGTVAQCISTGIDRDAISTTAEAVIRSAGCARLNRTAPPRAKDRGAASRSCTNLLPSPRHRFFLAFSIFSLSIASWRRSNILASIMPTSTSSTDPLQNRSTMRRTALAATRPRAWVA